jgi:flavin-binding protein dodecin
MAVEKSIDLSATGSTIDEAVSQAIHRASLTIQGLTTFEVRSIQGTVQEGGVTYKVLVRVWFVVKERVHE